MNWPAVGIIISMASLFFVINKAVNDNEQGHSSLCLEQIKSYFAKAAVFLKEGGNNNVKWHQAIEMLKMNDELKKYLTDDVHKHIYLIEYFNTALSIIDVIKDIDDFRFFYGLKDYKEKASNVLFEETYLENPEEVSFRVASESLQILCAYIDKANKMFRDLDRKNKNEIYKSEYFSSSLTEAVAFISDTSKETTLKIIFQYIKDFNQHEADRKKKNYDGTKQE